MNQREAYEEIIKSQHELMKADKALLSIAENRAKRAEDMIRNASRRSPQQLIEYWADPIGIVCSPTDLLIVDPCYVAEGGDAWQDLCRRRPLANHTDCGRLRFPIPGGGNELLEVTHSATRYGDGTFPVYGHKGEILGEVGVDSGTICVVWLDPWVRKVFSTHPPHHVLAEVTVIPQFQGMIVVPGDGNIYGFGSQSFIVDTGGTFGPDGDENELPAPPEERVTLKMIRDGVVVRERSRGAITAKVSWKEEE